MFVGFFFRKYFFHLGLHLLARQDGPPIMQDFLLASLWNIKQTATEAFKFRFSSNDPKTGYERLFSKELVSNLKFLNKVLIRTEGIVSEGCR